MNSEERLKALFSADSEQLAAVDAALTGRAEAAPPSLRLLKIGDAAKETGLSRSTIWRAIRDGRLVATEIRPGSRRIALAELQAFVAGGRKAAA